MPDEIPNTAPGIAKIVRVLHEGYIYSAGYADKKLRRVKVHDRSPFDTPAPPLLITKVIPTDKPAD